MEVLKNKKVLIALGLLILGGGFLYLRNKKAKENALAGSNSDTPIVGKNDYPISLGASDKDGNVWQVIDGKKYSIWGVPALTKYGLNINDYPFTVVTKEVLDSIPDGGHITEAGIVKL